MLFLFIFFYNFSSYCEKSDDTDSDEMVNEQENNESILNQGQTGFKHDENVEAIEKVLKYRLGRKIGVLKIKFLQYYKLQSKFLSSQCSEILIFRRSILS